MAAVQEPIQGHQLKPGTVVRARRRLWRVEAVRGDVLEASPLDGTSRELRLFYLPFERVEAAGLPVPDPSRLSVYADQQLLLRAYRLSMIHGSSALLSMQRSRVIPDAYQMVPVVMALNQERVRLLIADDVGLGKTIEAGLVVTELFARNLASRLLVICPANLREQWQEALHYFFHIDAEIISSQHLRRLERNLPLGESPWDHYRYLITSIDYVKTPAVRAQLLDRSWDAVIIDEAHWVAKPHQSSADQAVDMDRWEFARRFCRQVRHLLLLTATPHNGYSDSYASLLSLLDVGAVAGPPHDPHILREVARKHVCQRRRADVMDWHQREGDLPSPFPERDQAELTIQPSETETRVFQAVDAYGELLRLHAEGGSRHDRILANWTILHFHKRALSSPAALRASLRNRENALRRRLLPAEDDQPELPEEVARANALDYDAGDRYDDETVSKRVDHYLFGSDVMIRAELGVLSTLRALAETVTPSRDSKLQRLLKDTLPQLLGRSPKVVIFTRYRDTLEYLDEQIRRLERFHGCDVFTIHGQMSEGERAENFRSFATSSRAVLIATDCISEGINLQHAASQIIHYELPWNPNRLEQRNGRVDRYGQPAPEVTIRTMVMDESLDATILAVLVRKAEQIRRDYGFSPPFFGDDLSVVDLIKERLPHYRLTPAQISLFDSLPARRVSDTVDPFDETSLKRIQEESFYGQTDVLLSDVREKLERTREEVGSPEEVEKFVVSGLRRLGCQVDRQEGGGYRIALHDARLFGRGVEQVMRVTFDARRAQDDGSLTVLDIGHPLVMRLIEILKDESLSGESQRGRLAYLVSPAVKETTACIHLLARYLTASSPPRVFEELVPVAFAVYGDSVLDDAATTELLRVQPTASERSLATFREDLREALSRGDLDGMIHAALARRVAFHQEEQREFARGVGTSSRWQEGLDRIEVVSRDSLAITLYYPE